MNITESNKLIAEFMGVKPRMESPDVYTFNDGIFFSCRENNPEKVMDAIAKYSKYHTSWDWLMPVIGKILDISFQDEGDAEDFYSIRDCIPDINHTYRSVVEFIKKYNQNEES